VGGSLAFGMTVHFAKNPQTGLGQNCTEATLNWPRNLNLGIRFYRTYLECTINLFLCVGPAAGIEGSCPQWQRAGLRAAAGATLGATCRPLQPSPLTADNP